MCDKIIVIDRQHREMQSPLCRNMATKPEFLVAKDELLVALAPYRSQFRALGWLLKYYACVKPAVLQKERAKLALFSFFWGPSLIVMQDSRNGTHWQKHCFGMCTALRL